uniref:Protein kinase domain-containing protein n=1 Tax=Branchiostoma floridae TaxID=7739 RepID=C3ZQ73_BRAFL|eukprot:XP_002589441.1 hypothetical protein BRAFLDRAFT_80163 [Branchiostoma floridae]
MDEVVAGALSSTCAFIYVINSAIPMKKASKLLSYLLTLCQNHKRGKVFDLESTMFVCNKWDVVDQNERAVVKKDYLKKLKDHFPELRDDQVFFLSCKQAVGPTGKLSPEFDRLLDGLDKLLPQSLQHKLELQYQHVGVVLQKARQYIRLKLHCAFNNGTKEERQEAKEKAKSRLEKFNQIAEQVKRTQGEMLKAARREAEGLLRVFFQDESVKDSVLSKIMHSDDFQEVDNSEVCSTGLITAIADEIESQLENNPRASAFNQCIHDADIRLKEEFKTKFGALLKQQDNVIDEVLNLPPKHSKLKRLRKFFNDIIFRAASVFSSEPYMSALDRIIDHGYAIGALLNLAMKGTLLKMAESPDNRDKYISHFVNQVFGAMVKDIALKTVVIKHFEGLIDFHNSCKDAVPKLQRRVQKLIQDAASEKRSKEKIKKIYEPKSQEVCRLAEVFYDFYINNIKKHEFDMTNLSHCCNSFQNAGSYGHVHKVEVSKDGVTFTAAVKILHRETTVTEDFVREAENLREKSPAWWGSDPEKQAAAFSYTQNLAVQLCEGLKHIHGEGYIHRDLKLSNVLVTEKGVVKLADLGSTKRERNYAQSLEGTPLYTAPEVKAQKKYDKSADIYSLGLILLEMWYGRTIYCKEEPGYDSQLQKALPLNVGKKLPLPSWDGGAPPILEWRKLINDCLRRNPGLRPTAENCRDRIAGMSLLEVGISV